jgi:hypothetical protein
MMLLQKGHYIRIVKWSFPPISDFLRKWLHEMSRTKQIAVVVYAANPSILMTSVLGQRRTSAANMFLKYQTMKF